jgi:enoyl-CoA hydratase/carnithine racemase
MARRFEEYAELYENVRMTRHDGILEVQLHTERGPLVWSVPAHRDLGDCFVDIGADWENRVVIITGTGGEFCTRSVWPYPDWNNVYWEGKRLLMNLLDIEVPIIAAVNGPALVHAELLVLNDIVLAADTASFRDGHFVHGTVPGDGVHVVWPALLGENRGRHFLLTGRELSASEALDLGVVSEVLAPTALMDRARALAADIAPRDDSLRRYTRVLFTQRWKRRMLDDLGPGLAVEGLARERRIRDAAR